jgi:hypothetical protein
MESQSLLLYQKNVTSQCGEDGVIEEICRRLNIERGFFVEVGAWDGKHLSNTYSLLKKGWRGVYIEGDGRRYQDLLNTKNEFPTQIATICAFVHYEGEKTLDRLLSQTSTPADFDLLSIDIDSYDWQVWESLHNYSPKIVIVEGNSTLLPGVWQVHEDGITRGSSFTALVKLGEHKGYKLICHTGNLFFIKKEFLPQMNLNPIYALFPETLFNYRKHFEELKYQRQLRFRVARIVPHGLRKPLRRLRDGLRRVCTRLGNSGLTSEGTKST